MSEMIVRVAKAICLDRAKHWEHMSSEARASWKETAIAAINEMKTPTNKMLNAAAKSMSPEKRPMPEFVSSKVKHRVRYQAMIDAALQDSPPIIRVEGETQ